MATRIVYRSNTPGTGTEQRSVSRRPVITVTFDGDEITFSTTILNDVRNAWQALCKDVIKGVIQKRAPHFPVEEVERDSERYEFLFCDPRFAKANVVNVSFELDMRNGTIRSQWKEVTTTDSSKFTPDPRTLDEKQEIMRNIFGGIRDSFRYFTLTMGTTQELKIQETELAAGGLGNLTDKFAAMTTSANEQ